MAEALSVVRTGVCHARECAGPCELCLPPRCLVDYSSTSCRQGQLCRYRRLPLGACCSRPGLDKGSFPHAACPVLVHLSPCKDSFCMLYTRCWNDTRWPSGPPPCLVWPTMAQHWQGAVSTGYSLYVETTAFDLNFEGGCGCFQVRRGQGWGGHWTRQQRDQLDAQRAFTHCLSAADFFTLSDLTPDPTFRASLRAALDCPYLTCRALGMRSLLRLMVSLQTTGATNKHVPFPGASSILACPLFDDSASRRVHADLC